MAHHVTQVHMLVKPKDATPGKQVKISGSIPDHMFRHMGYIAFYNYEQNAEGTIIPKERIFPETGTVIVTASEEGIEGTFGGITNGEMTLKGKDSPKRPNLCGSIQNISVEFKDIPVNLDGPLGQSLAVFTLNSFDK